MQGGVDGPEDGLVVAPSEAITVCGWFVDAADAAIEIVAGDATWHPTRTVPRPDVAAAIPAARDRATDAGWAAEITIEAVGDHEVIVLARRRDEVPVEVGRRTVRVVRPSPWESLTGAIDRPREGDELGRYGLVLSGWLPPDERRARIEVLVDGKLLGLARPFVPRPDIGALDPDDPLAALAGFESFLEPAPRGGPMSIRVRAVDTDGAMTHETAPVVITRRSDTTRSERATFPARARPRPPRRSPGVVLFTHSLQVGGAQVFAGLLAEQLRSRTRWRPTVLSPTDGPWRERLQQRVPVELVGRADLDDHEAYERCVDGLQRRLEALDPRAVIVNTREAFPAADAALRSGLPVAWAVHETTSIANYWGARSTRPDDAVAARLEAVAGHADAVVFVTDRTRVVYDEVLEDNARVIPYGMELDAIRRRATPRARRAARTALGLSDDAVVVVWPARFDPMKMHTTLVAVARRLAERHPAMQLFLVGRSATAVDHAYTDAVERFVADSGHADAIHIVDITTDPWPWFSAADLMVCPSDSESLPFAVLEAMAFGVPVVATSVAGIPDVITDPDTGWLVDARDAAALERALDAAIGDPHERARRAANAREVVRGRHALKPWLNSWAALLDDLAQR